MPSISDFKAKNKGAAQVRPQSQPAKKAQTAEASPKRRPGREKQMSDTNVNTVKVVDVDLEVKPSESNNETNSSDAHESTHESGHAQAKAGIEIHFPGSEILRAKFPQTFSAADKVATDWAQDGDFADLPLPGPAQATAQMGLKKAKELEKKIMNSPLTEKITMQAFSSLMKAQNFFNQIKEKVQRK
jgi:hypothetical protein